VTILYFSWQWAVLLCFGHSADAEGAAGAAGAPGNTLGSSIEIDLCTSTLTCACFMFGTEIPVYSSRGETVASPALSFHGADRGNEKLVVVVVVVVCI